MTHFAMSYFLDPTGEMTREESREVEERRKPFIINFKSFIEDDLGERYDCQIVGIAERPERGTLQINSYTSVLHRPLINQVEPVYTEEQILAAAKEAILDMYQGENIKFNY